MNRDPQWIDPEYEELRQEIAERLDDIADEKAIRRMEEERDDRR